MNIDQLKNRLPEAAKDIKLNLAFVVSEEGSSDLTLKQIYQVALASAFSVKNSDLLETILFESRTHLFDKEIEAAKSAAIIMAMNNVYYRFIHLVNDKSFSALPTKLRMNVINNPGIEKIDFELCCLAVSAINGCGLCMDAHTKELTKAGLSKTAIQSAIRIASVLNAVNLGLSMSTTGN